MAGRRTRARSSSSGGPPFRAWGLVYLVFVGLLTHAEQWWAAALVTGFYTIYVAWLRISVCRVETTQGRGCRWRVRGMLGCCSYHLGLKRGLPVLRRAPGDVVPRFMWPRRDLELGQRPRELATPQPSPGISRREASIRREGIGDDRKMLWLAVASLVVTFVALVRDFIAG